MENIPKEILDILKRLQKNGHDSYIVGGCVRDYLLGKHPADWDITTSANPREIQKIFSPSFYENNFGTVTVLTKSEDPALREIEITPFRIEGKYSDRRHPDEIQWAKTIEKDLSRRDFTVNALAIKIKSKIQNLKPEINSKFPRPFWRKERDRQILNSKFLLIDLFNGRNDLKNKIIRAVGNPDERFQEDALRMMRAARLTAKLNFSIEEKTAEAIKKNADLLREIAAERIRDELVKILLIPPARPAESLKFWEESKLNQEDLESGAARGINLLRELGILKYIIPELEQGIGVTQNKHHIFTVWEHNIRALAYAAKMGFSLDVIIASLFHDIGKPLSKRGDGWDSTFYGHEVAGAKMVFKILKRLRFPADQRDKIVKLVRWHLFFSDPEKVTLSAVKRIIRRVDKENIWELINVRKADRIGSGVPKAEPFRLRTYKALIDQGLREPISLKMLKINGDDIMRILNLPPSIKVGLILKSLMGEVLDDALKNNKKYLEARMKELNELSEAEIKKSSWRGEEKWEEVEEKAIREIKKKHHID